MLDVSPAAPAPGQPRHMCEARHQVSHLHSLQLYTDPTHRRLSLRGAKHFYWTIFFPSCSCKPSFVIKMVLQTRNLSFKRIALAGCWRSIVPWYTNCPTLKFTVYVKLLHFRRGRCVLCIAIATARPPETFSRKNAGSDKKCSTFSDSSKNLTAKSEIFKSLRETKIFRIHIFVIS